MQAPPPSEPDSDYPLMNVDTYHPHDVLCGRGGGTNNHIGNENWRNLIAANKRLYISLPKRQKMLVAQSIVKAVRSQTPPGRFLSRDSKTKKWNDIGDQKAQDKTSQALREGAPDIREEMREEKRLGIPAGAPGAPASPFFMANSPLSSMAAASGPSGYKSDTNPKAPIGSPETSSTSPYVGSVGGIPPMLGASAAVATSGAAVPGQSPAMMPQQQQQATQQGPILPPQYPSVPANMMPRQHPGHEQQQSATVKAYVQNSLDRTSPVPPGMPPYGGRQDQHSSGERSPKESSGSEKAKRKAVDSSTESSANIGVNSNYGGSGGRGSDRGGHSPSPSGHSPSPAPQDFAPERFLPNAPMGHQVEHRLMDDDWNDALTAHTQRVVNGEDGSTGMGPRVSSPVDANNPKDAGAGGYHSSGSGRYDGSDRASPHPVSGAAGGNSNLDNREGPRASKHDVDARLNPNMFNSEKVDNADMVPPPPRRPTFDATNPGFDLPLGTIEGLMGEGGADGTGVDANGLFGAVAAGGNKKSLIDMSDDEDEDGDDADLRPEFAQLKKLLTPLNKPAVPQAPGPTDLGRDPSYAFTDFSVDDMSMTSMAISRGASQAFPGAPGQNVEMTSLSRDLSLALSDMSLSRGVSQNTDINRLREKIEMEYLTRGHSLALSDFGTANGRNQSLGLNDFGPGGQPKGTSPAASAAAASTFNEFPGFGNEKDSA